MPIKCYLENLCDLEVKRRAATCDVGAPLELEDVALFSVQNPTW
jgi:hypothetical protein